MDVDTDGRGYHLEAGEPVRVRGPVGDGSEPFPSVADIRRTHLLEALHQVDVAMLKIERRAETGAEPTISGLDRLREDIVASLRSQ